MSKRATILILFILLAIYVSSTYALGSKINQESVKVSGQTLSISNARQQPLGSTVSITGIVTVSSQFGGPAFIQDSSGGIAIYDATGKLYPEITIGDSLLVMGTLSNYHGLLELTDISYTCISRNKIVKSLSISTAQISEKYEGRLVTVANSKFSKTGTFKGGTNYSVKDNSGSVIVRIDKDTDIPGTQIPTSPVNLVGVIEEYDGTYELLPRSRVDAGAILFPTAGKNVPLNQTLDVATWNMEWFGDPDKGPTNDSLQIVNAASVLKKIDADLYGVEEVSDPKAFHKLLSLLPGYSGFESDYTQTQKTAFIYKTSTIDSVSSKMIEPSGFSSWDYYWANGRPPLEFTFTATINGQTKTINAIDIHAKAMSDQTSYDRRFYASKELKDYLDNNMNTANIIILGDYNDDVDKSIFNGNPSPYQNFMDDPTHYKVVTALLSKRGEVSTTSYGDMIDHITISNELFSSFFDSTQKVIDPAYIPNYGYTTSDHYPVMARFRLDNTVGISNDRPQLPTKSYLEQNYPNPFNPTTNIRFNLNKRVLATLTVYNLIGQKVAILLDHQSLPAGEHSITFDAHLLPSSIYFYRLTLSSGQMFTRKMTLVK